MNPFDWQGPPFLLAFIVFAVGVNVALRLFQRHREAQWPMPRLDSSDPYKIAYLRGGAPEALKIAAFSLLDRKLLRAEGDRLVQATFAKERVRRPIEQAVLKRFATAKEVSALFKDAANEPACRQYHQELVQLRLLAGGGERSGRLGALLVALGALGGVASLKVFLAISRGRHNIGFLIVIAVIACIVACVALFRRTTGLGERFLKDQRTLFARLRKRAANLSSGGSSNEAVILAAVFGLAVLPANAFPFIEQLQPKPASSDSSSSSGCGSSGDSGSSCGGGGGCGGCG